MNLVVSHWSANIVVLAGYAVVAGVHLRGMRGLPTTAGRQRWAGAFDRQAAAFHAGLLVVVLALVSPVGYWSYQFIWVRSVQDLLLAIVAPGLIVLGAPWLALRQGLGRRGQDGAPGPGAERAEPHPASPSGALEWSAMPLAATAAFSVVWCGWHLPAAYDAALSNPLVYSAQAVTYLGFGGLFWLQLIGSRPWYPPLAPLRRVALLTVTVAISTVLAMVLVFGSGLLYPAYLGSEHHAFSVVADQQVGGAVLWVLMLPPYAITAVGLLIRWLNDEESQALATGLDRLLKPTKSAWPSRPGLR